jgi:hypothetical protein
MGDPSATPASSMNLKDKKYNNPEVKYGATYYNCASLATAVVKNIKKK